MKKSNKIEWAIWGFSALPLVATLVLYQWLPANIPLHWNMAGEIDGYGTRAEAFLIPAITLLVSALLKWMPRLDPKQDNYNKFSAGYNALRLVLALFLCIVTGVTLLASFAPERIDVPTIVCAGVGMLFCVFGNFMPTFKFNYFCGIRTPWTLASENVWRSTHRMAGPLWVIGGALLLVGSFILHGAALFTLLLVVACAISFVPCIYSYFAYKREKKH
jgi:uncharacterized membrane protein